MGWDAFYSANDVVSGSGYTGSDYYAQVRQADAQSRIQRSSGLAGQGDQSRTQQSNQSKNDQSGVKVTLSKEALEKIGLDKNDEKNQPGQLSKEEQAEVDELKTTDRKVRTHEQAHMAAGGSLVRRGASYNYETGPDGVRYAVGGDVQIDTSKEKDPKDTVTKAQRIIRAALAPADPSPQDRRVAADAATMLAQAQMEVAKEKTGSGDANSSGSAKGVGEAGSAGKTNGSDNQNGSGAGSAVGQSQKSETDTQSNSGVKETQSTGTKSASSVSAKKENSSYSVNTTNVIQQAYKNNLGNASNLAANYSYYA